MLFHENRLSVISYLVFVENWGRCRKICCLLQLCLALKGLSRGLLIHSLFKYFSSLQIESPILIQPFLKDMTNSELHAVMTGGYATIAGSALVIFTSFGVSMPMNVA